MARASALHAKATQPKPSFVSFEDFEPAYTAARQRCAAVYGENWHLHPQAYIWARLPVEWVRVEVAGRTTPLPLKPRLDPNRFAGWDQLPKREPLPDEVIGKRWSRAPRDVRLPVARFWPDGLPIGPEYESGPPTTKPSKPRLVRNAEPQKPRRPSGIGLASGRERAEGDFYIEPRWLVDALLEVEPFDGTILDPFCGSGNIVGTCLQRGLSATGSDLYDRGFGQRRDAFDIVRPLDNVVANPPFALIEQVIRHFLPLVRRKLVLLARLNILEGQDRRALFDESPPARVWVSSRRASIPPGDLAHPRDRFGAMDPLPSTGGSTAYCWTVWDHAYRGPTTLGWL
jgi:hypothetical protein